jgi:two-component system LytT family response regulator
MQYNLLVADDNIIERDAVVHMLRQLPQTRSIITCEDGFQVMQTLEKHQIDVIFSDIEMPGMDGHSLLRNLPDAPPFVFITSYADYAVESFNVDAIDFVVKPITFSRLAKGAEKAFEYIALKRAVNNNLPKGLNELMSANTSATEDHFFIRETKGITRLAYSDVMYIESMGDFSKIFKTDGHTHVILSGLKSLEGQLPAKLFKRVHKQYIVNLMHMQTISRNGVLMSDGSNIPLSAVFRQEILTAFVSKEPLKRS